MHHTDVGSTSVLQVFIHMRHKLSVRHRKCRSVDELATFYIFRLVSNDFHILLKYMHNSVRLGPVCVGKSYPTFHNLYDKNIPKCHSHHSYVDRSNLYCKTNYMKIPTRNGDAYFNKTKQNKTRCFILCQYLLNV